MAILSFDPNGAGQTTLATDMDITASFSGGSPSDGFVAPAGDTLAQLTSLVNTNLGASGFGVLGAVLRSRRRPGRHAV